MYLDLGRKQNCFLNHRITVEKLLQWSLCSLFSRRYPWPIIQSLLTYLNTVLIILVTWILRLLTACWRRRKAVRWRQGATGCSTDRGERGVRPSFMVRQCLKIGVYCDDRGMSYVPVCQYILCRDVIKYQQYFTGCVPWAVSFPTDVVKF